MNDVLSRLVERERLPSTFTDTFEAVCRPLAGIAAELRADLGRTAVLGLCGPQGSGKSTIAAGAAGLLEAQGLKTAVLSLDDLYLTQSRRRRLAADIHPLFSVRGPPGTHDVALGAEVLAGLAGPDSTPLPRFDKATDERAPAGDWPIVDGPADVVLFEGWCVGARAQPDAELARPVNDLEAERDSDGIWRANVNASLDRDYPALFASIDHLTLLAAPGFEVVAGWREDQEAKLRARTGGGMTPAEVGRFIQHYERLTRWILAEMPDRADWTVRMDSQRRV